MCNYNLLRNLEVRCIKQGAVGFLHVWFIVNSSIYLLILFILFPPFLPLKFFAPFILLTFSIYLAGGDSQGVIWNRWRSQHQWKEWITANNTFLYAVTCSSSTIYTTALLKSRTRLYPHICFPRHSKGNCFFVKVERMLLCHVNWAFTFFLALTHFMVQWVTHQSNKLFCFLATHFFERWYERFWKNIKPC